MSAAPITSDLREVGFPMVDRLATVFVVAVPPALVVLAVVFSWGSVLHWPDPVVLTVTYLISGFGIGVGFHRLFTHRSFKARSSRPLPRPSRLAVRRPNESRRGALRGPCLSHVGSPRPRTTADRPLGAVIWLLEKLGLVSDVVRISPARIRGKVLTRR